jgi:succinylglutamate desuccinylase
MKNKILIIAATHGNETIGLEVVQRLENAGLEKYFDFLIGNPKALKAKKRFIKVDLNRSYPGKKYSRIYEQKLAYDNLKIARQYKYIIDIHEASSGVDDFIIVPRKTTSKKFPLNFIRLKRIILWPEPKGPISQVLKNGIELEFGMKDKNRATTINRATNIISQLIDSVYSEKKKSYKQEKFYVYGKLLLSKTPSKNRKLKDFKLTSLNNESFYPLLTGQYEKDSIACYKMIKMDK